MTDAPWNLTRSRAALIGTGTYTHLPQVPAALNSLSRFHGLLTSQLCGWPGESVSVFANRREPGDLPDQLVELFQDARDVALFYYVGHGQVDPMDTLCLGLVESRNAAQRRRTTSLPFDAVRYALTQSPARVKVVILDCCYAGLAAPGTLSPGDVSDLTRGTGAYTVSAAGEFSKAWFEFGEDVVTPQTYFTKYLVDVIEAGIPAEGSELRLESIFHEVTEALARDGKPVPTSRSAGHAARFAFARNAMHDRRGRAPSSPDPGQRSLVIIKGAGDVPAGPGIDPHNLGAMLADKLHCQLALPELLDDPTSEDIAAGLDGWLSAPARGDGDVLIVYYTGMSRKSADGHYAIVGRDSAHAPAAPGDVPLQLARTLEASRIREALVLADTWALDEAASDGSPRVFLPGAGSVDSADGRRWRYLIADRANGRAAGLPLARMLAEELDDPRYGRVNQAYLDPDSLLRSMNDRISADKGMAVSLGIGSIGSPSRLLPNPRYHPQIPLGLDIRSQRSALSRDDLLAHWSPRSRGVQSEGDPGWHFTGRAKVLRELVAWLVGAADGRMRVVTGGPGSGKSAVIGRLVTLADAAYRVRIPVTELSDGATVPPVGSIDIGIHARGKTVDDVVALIATAAGVTAGGPNDLVAALMRLDTGITIAIDALDESISPKALARSLIAPLATAWRSGIKVLIGTRRELLPSLGGGKVTIDLDEPGYASHADLAQYVLKTMLDSEISPYADRPRLAEIVATAVAARAFPNYLIGRIVGHTLSEEDTPVDIARREWRLSFPSTVGDALDGYLERFGENEQRVRELLEPLAYAAGEGLPWENMWAPIASALSGTAYTDRDVRWVLEEAGAYILETAEEGRSVYRLFHQALADHLRQRAREADANRQIMRVLTAATTKFPRSSRSDWRRSHPYIQRHLCQHAARANELDGFVTDPVFLISATPSVLVSMLPTVSSEYAKQAARTYQHAVHRLTAGAFADNAAALELVARCDGDNELAEELRALELGQPWRAAWVHWSSSPDYRLIGQHPGGTNAIAVTEFDGEAIVVSAGQDGTIHRFSVTESAPFGEPFTAHQDAVTSVAVAAVDGRPLIVSGGQDGTIRRFDLADGIPVGDPLPAHQGTVTSVAVAAVDGRPLIVSGGQDGTIRRFDLADGIPVGEPLSGTGNPLSSVAIMIASTGPIIAAGDDYWDITCWDAATGEHRGNLTRAHEAQVTAVAAGISDMGPLLASGSSDTTVLLHDLREFADEPQPSIKLVHDGSISGIAFWTIDDRTVLITASADTTIRCWDVEEVLASASDTAHSEGVSALAVGTLSNQPFIAGGGADGHIYWWDMETGTLTRSSPTAHSDWLNDMTAQDDVVLSAGGDGTVRQWDAATGREMTEPMLDEGAWINAVTCWTSGTSAARPGARIAVAGDNKGLIRRWNLENARQIGDPLEGHSGSITGVSVIEIGQDPILVSSGADKTIRRWNLFSGDPVGQPLRGHTERIWNVVTYKDRGRAIALSGDEKGYVLGWDLSGGEQIARWKAHSSEVLALRVGIIAGRRRIITGGGDGVLRIWRSFGAVEHTIALGSTVWVIAVSSPDHVLVGTYRGMVDIRLAT